MAAHRWHGRRLGVVPRGVEEQEDERKSLGKEGVDCTGYITRHSWLSPMRCNARSRTSGIPTGKVYYRTAKSGLQDRRWVTKRTNLCECILLSQLHLLHYPINHSWPFCMYCPLQISLLALLALPFAGSLAWEGFLSSVCLEFHAIRGRKYMFFYVTEQFLHELSIYKLVMTRFMDM